MLISIVILIVYHTQIDVTFDVIEAFHYHFHSFEHTYTTFSASEFRNDSLFLFSFYFSPSTVIISF